jgi:hypothetical protein
MKCQICGIEVPCELNSVVCSDKCADIRLKVFELVNKYYPSSGCPNCWGDLHQSCTDVCKKETHDGYLFATDLWSLVRMIYS